ncbi:MAG TPA: MFS transporter [Bryobacteraceae bacterium]|nr:MFS transporter [Bryobacteraceae bacterium]
MTAPRLAVLACGMAAALWLGLPPAAPSGAGVAPAIGLLAGSLIAGLTIGRSGRKAALVCGLAWLSAGLWCLAAAPASHAWMRLSMGALGLGAGMSFLAANALVWAAAPANRAAALNLLNVALPLGVLVNPVLPPATALPASAALATLALAFAAWMPLAPFAPAPLDTAAVEKRPAIFLLALLLFLYAACEAGTWIWLVEYWRSTRVLDRQTAWLIQASGLPLGLMAGRAGAARLLAAIPPLTVVRFAGFAMAFATALMLLARSASASCVAAVVVGAAMAPVLPTVLGMAGEALPRWPATGMAMALAAGWLGLAASSPLIVGIANRSSLSAAMMLLPALSLAMALVAMAMRKPGRGESAKARGPAA